MQETNLLQRSIILAGSGNTDEREKTMIRVLVVDDSAFSRKIIAKILESIPDVEVVDSARDGQEAIKKTMRLRPDLITLDLEMPNMNGFTFLRWLMSYLPTPVIVVSAQKADESVFKAMDLGAVDFVAKPTHHASLRLKEIEADLIQKVLAVPLLTIAKIKERMEQKPEGTLKLLEKRMRRSSLPLIGIGSSTGGPPAIQTIIQSLPPGFDVPVLIAQHMPPGFTSFFAERLNRLTSLQVKEAANDDLLVPGAIYIAPGGKNLTVERHGSHMIACLKERRQDHRYCPSVDLLLNSIAQEAQASAIGVILTGMGDDGKAGLKEIKEKGGITIAESEQTAIIYGMPQEAAKTGAVDFVLPLSEIAGALTSLTDIRNDKS